MQSGAPCAGAGGHREADAGFAQGISSEGGLDGVGEFREPGEDDADAGGGGAEALQMGTETEDLASVGAHRLEEALAVEKAVVEDGDLGLVGREEGAVEPDEGSRHLSMLSSGRPCKTGEEARHEG